MTKINVKEIPKYNDFLLKQSDDDYDRVNRWLMEAFEAGYKRGVCESVEIELITPEDVNPIEWVEDK